MALWGEAAFGMGNQGLPGTMSAYPVFAHRE
jgi:hypothetical protein